ncbi:hypothetical protein [Clostridium beijerinckii]|uniref:hypothetical protein n=2 Tax=Clostridiaceae TaxID=31979 RepID=UPI001FB162F1|nr:hypothetical protein [Clostridium beijerinckii]
MSKLLNSATLKKLISLINFALNILWKGKYLMKKSTIVFFIFLLLSFTNLAQNTSAAPISLSQGIYNVRDINLPIGSPVTARINDPNGRVIIFVIDNNQYMRELTRLDSQSNEQTLKPFNYGYSVIIFGNTPVTFS